jgi:hypothetical protein
MNLLYAPQHSIDGDYYLAPPARPLSPADARWIELHTALISAGVPPQPGDRTVVHTLASQLDDTTVDAIVAWIDIAATHTTARTRPKVMP